MKTVMRPEPAHLSNRREPRAGRDEFFYGHTRHGPCEVAFLQGRPSVSIRHGGQRMYMSVPHSPRRSRRNATRLAELCARFLDANPQPREDNAHE